MMAEGSSELTIDQLAHRTGMSARNIRAHQSRGLLAPPTLRGRTGYYNDAHVARIELIQRLQADGFSLALIKRLLRAARDSTDEVVRLSDAIHGPFGDEQPRVVGLTDLQRRFRSTSGEVFTRLEELRVLRRLGNGRVELVTPQAFQGGEVLSELGASAEELTEAVAEVRKHVDAIARTCLRLFLDHVWLPFEQAGRPDEGLEPVLEAIERLRPLVNNTVSSLFQMAMADVIERRIGTELRRLEPQRRG
jgi:DNA-binding transcriptional MerR regulator